MKLSQGVLLDLWDGAEVRPAVFLGEEKGRIRVVTVQGRELKIPESRVANDGEVRLTPLGDPVAVGERLRAIDQEMHAAAKAVDVESLWEILADNGGTYDLDELAELALGERSGRSRSVVLRRLLTDQVYFVRRRLEFRPHTREELGQVVERLQAEERRAQQRSAFLESARLRLGGPASECSGWPDGAQRWIDVLIGLAVHGLDYPDIKEAQQLLTDLGAGSRGEPAIAAFETLVRLGVLADDDNLLLRRHKVAKEFPPEVLEAAAAVAAAPLQRGQRRDFTEWPCFAIDDAQTTEVDDAISLERLDGDRVRLGIHIADPEPYVPQGGVVDQCARDRGTTFYLPEQRILMLPPAIAEGVASLTAGEVRTALSALVDLAADGTVIDFQFHRSLIRVTRRLTYEEADALIIQGGGAPALFESAADFQPPVLTPELAALIPPDLPPQTAADLTTAARLAHAILERRAAAGALILKGPDLDIKVTAGKITTRRIEPWTPSWVLVSEAMVLMNWLAARLLRDASMPAVFRRQAAPDQALNVPRVYDPAAAAAARRRIKPSDTSLTPGPHAGLGLDVYVQCTSPLRRYQDLVSHRQLEAAMQGLEPAYTSDELWAIVQGCSESEKAAREIERGNREYWLLRYLESLPADTVLDATITRPEDRRTLVELTRYPYFAQLPPDPSHKPGQPIRVVVDAVSPRAGRLILRQV